MRRRCLPCYVIVAKQRRKQGQLLGTQGATSAQMMHAVDATVEILVTALARGSLSRLGIGGFHTRENLIGFGAFLDVLSLVATQLTRGLSLRRCLLSLLGQYLDRQRDQWNILDIVYIEIGIV